MSDVIDTKKSLKWWSHCQFYFILFEVKKCLTFSFDLNWKWQLLIEKVLGRRRADGHSLSFTYNDYFIEYINNWCLCTYWKASLVSGSFRFWANTSKFINILISRNFFSSASLHLVSVCHILWLTGHTYWLISCAAFYNEIPPHSLTSSLLFSMREKFVSRLIFS